MEYRTTGKILRGVGGLYLIDLAHDDTPLAGFCVSCRARGALRSGDNRPHTTDKPLVGDNVEVTYSDSSFTVTSDGKVIAADDTSGLPGAAVCGILPRKNALIRPPLANLDLLFISCASASPAPAPETIDKLLSVAEYYGIDAAVVIEKSDLDPERAAEIKRIYELAGYPVFSLSCLTGEGIAEFSDYIRKVIPGRTAAFAGASGVGKSSLITAVFPHLDLESGEISRKISRGKHTTRKVELYPIPGGGHLADTPGFSLIDFENFDFFPFEALTDTMRDFSPYLGLCRYDDCTHTKEEGCAIIEAVKNGQISRSRHESYVNMFEVLKNKHPWDKPKR